MATVCFLLLAGAFVYACVLLVGSVLRQELLQGGDRPKTPREQDFSASMPQDAPAPTEPIADVSAILVPPESDDSESAVPDAAATPAFAETPAPTPTPAPTLRPLTPAAPLSSAHAEFALVGFDAGGRADWLAAVRMHEGRCTVLSVPRNTLSAAQTPLMRATSVSYAMRMLRTVWPVSYPYYVELKLPGIPLCVDQCGGVTIGGKRLTGEQAQAWLEASGADELLRIERQQTLMRAYLAELQQTSWLKLLTFRFAMQEFVDSNLTIAQLLELYTQFKQVDVDEIAFHILPVDSVTVDGARCYTPDAALVNRMLESRAAD